MKYTITLTPEQDGTLARQLVMSTPGYTSEAMLTDIVSGALMQYAERQAQNHVIMVSNAYLAADEASRHQAMSVLSLATGRVLPPMAGGSNGSPPSFMRRALRAVKPAYWGGAGLLVLAGAAFELVPR